MRKYGEEENFDEALNRVFLATKPYNIPDEIQGILNDPKSTNLTDDPYWVVINAIRQFVHNEGHGKLPLLGTVPDLHADSESFIRLQHVYLNKANSDLEIVKNYVKQNLRKLGKNSDEITDAYIKLCCRNSLVLRVLRYRTLEQELTSPIVANLESVMIDFMTMEPGNGLWYILLRAAERFYIEHKRYPGERKDYAEDYYDLKKHADALVKEFGLNETQIADEPIFEICRYANSQLHSIAAFIGGVAAQEIIKLVTMKWVPLNNTFVYNGIKGSSASFEI